MQISIETITPDLAKEYLKINHNNRKFSDRHVTTLANEMSREWKLNGDAIRFSQERLIDGQHRLMACVKSGMPFTTVVARNVNDDVFDTIDCGSKRTASQVLSIRGEKYACCLSSMLRKIHLYNIGKITKSEKVTSTTIEEVLKENPDARQSAAWAANHKRFSVINVSDLAFLHYLFSSIDREDGHNFMSKVVSGLGLCASDPEYILREKIAREKSTNKDLKKGVVIAYSIKAWNAKRSGGDLKRLAWGKDKEFPVAV